MAELLNPEREIVFTLQDLPEVANELLEKSAGLNIWMLHGAMGAGKTTLVRQIVAQCGVNTNVSSPTFSIVNEYGSHEEKVIYHFDLYRLKNEAEALDIGIDEYLGSGNLCLIEWPDKIKSLWPEKYLEIFIEHHSTSTRKIYYRRHD